MPIKQIESVKEFGGFLNRYTHESTSCSCEMTFSVYLPPLAENEKVPAVYWLSGLTCTDDNFRTKAGAQRYASELGIALIIPDTSPRGEDVPDQENRYDLGKGAGFYVNATQAPWSKNYQMYQYITDELITVAEDNFPIISGVRSITGHSMGGHGALISALKNPDLYRSVSAFAPIANPVNCDWGKACFGTYLGDDETTWDNYDATQLIASGATLPATLIDQGLADEFLAEQLLISTLKDAAEQVALPINIRMHEGYDHSYHFISTFIGEHLAFHETALRA